MSDDDLFTAKEIAKEVGVAVGTIYVWTQRGFLSPADKQGRFNRYRLADALNVEAARSHKNRRKS